MNYSIGLHAMEAAEINTLALRLLTRLLQYSSISLVSKLTGLSKPTLTRWMDPQSPTENMDPHKAGWFILMMETKPQLLLIMDMKPSRRHLAHRLVEDDNRTENTK